jgi:hypothetical protein
MERKHNPELLRDALFRRCKQFWAAGLIGKAIVFAVGAVVVLYPAHGKAFAIAALVLGILSEAALSSSDRWKSRAQDWQRKLDFENSLGWRIPNAELVDALARYSGSLEALLADPKGSYFASTEPAGPKRALENIRESSWWSMNLAEVMGWCFVVLIAAIIAGCVLLLNISIESVLPAVVNPETAPKTLEVVSAGVVKIVTSSLLFILSYGLLRSAVGYFRFSAKAEKVKEKAESLLGSGNSDEIQAIKLWQDYHLARAEAPLIPNWAWRLREKKLNALWRNYMCEASEKPAPAP